MSTATTAPPTHTTHPVRLNRHSVILPHPCVALTRLQQALGHEDVFLLESVSGPAKDSSSSILGVTGLLEVTVTRGQVRLMGRPALVEQAAQSLARGLGSGPDPDGSIPLPSPESLWELPELLASTFPAEVGADTFGFGMLALYGYDAVRYIERLPSAIPARADEAPDAVFSLVHALLEQDLRSGQAVLTVAESDAWPALDCALVLDLIQAPTRPDERRHDDEVPVPRDVHDSMTSQQFQDVVERCLEHIRVGDIYQVQVGHEVTVHSDVEPMTVYRRLRHRNPSPYMAYLPVAGHVIVGASPELFLRVEGDRATMRPIAGTAARRDDVVQDAAAVERLLADPKERAEHIMLVDLCRNDLGRVAHPGSLDVTELCVVEDYSHLHHIVSKVECHLAVPGDTQDVVRSAFPAGTMTGAPKIRAMEIIENLETSRRGFYAGAFGLVGFGGWTVLGLAIRMAVRTPDAYVLRASAGVVADSTASGEWQETLTKLAAPYWAVTGQDIR